MVKVRVFKLAKEFGISSKEMEARLKSMGYPIKNYMSTLEDYEADQIRAKMREALSGHGDKSQKKEDESKVIVKRRHPVVRLKKKIVIRKKVAKEEVKEVPEVPEEVPEAKQIPKEAEVKEVKEVKEGQVAAKEEEKEESVAREEGPPEKGVEEEAPIEEEAPPAVQKKEAEKEQLERPAERPSRVFKETKGLVKVIDHRPIEEIRPSSFKRPQRPEVKAHKKEEVKAPIAGKEPSTPEVQRKPRKKGKRVVQISELKGLVRKKRPPKQKGKERLKPINKILTEEVIEPEAEMQQGVPILEVGKTRPSKKAKTKEPKVKPPSTVPPKVGKRRFAIYETIQVDELAKRMGTKVADVIVKLMGLGVMATANQSIDYDVAALVASEFGYDVEKRAAVEDLVHMEEEESEGELLPRPPVVTVMGHVDHGKTTLLDAIRHADVAAKEAGGITQHIGAYQVVLPSGNRIVFLDTPGHEAFTQMRARGAQVTDIVVLVVAADDGVMAQTREAIDHARAAGVPIIVAINKIDKPGANPDRVKTEISELGLVPEEWGGDTIFVEISAKKRIGIEEFLELLALQAEVMELKADPTIAARGHVIEARLDKGRGPVATLLVSKGTLKKGDPIVCGFHYGKVRALLNDRGEQIDSAGPSTPVEVQGLSGVPEPGSEFVVLSDEKKAREVAEYRQRKHREAELAKGQKVSLETMFQRLQEQEAKELNIVLKADVQGSLEAMSEALRKLSTPEIKLNLVRTGIGAIAETDVLLASASDAIIVGFNVRPNAQARTLAEQEKVEIRFYDVIYHAIEEIKKAMVGLLEPVYEEEVVGHAEVRRTFRVPKLGIIAGCYVLDGLIRRNCNVRLLRENIVVYTGRIASMKRFKDDVKEVASGYECGIGLENFNDIKIGDVIEAYEMKEVAPSLGASPGKSDHEP